MPPILKDNMDPNDMQMMDAKMSSMPETVEPEMGAGEVCVPLKALAQPDDSDAMVTPEAGDSVSFQTDAILTRIDGENAYLKPSAINGTPIGKEAAAPEATETMVDDGEALRNEAMGGAM